jgi:LacI family transcriptional regulator, galactose operon repressor
MATIKDVALRAGVSVATVSHVLNATKPVGTVNTARVLRAAKALGYQPNRSARALRKGYSQAIGLLFPDLRNPFFSEIVHSVEKEARRVGHGLILVDTSGDAAEEQRGFAWLSEHQVAGAIWIPASNKPPGRSFPVVAVDRPYSGIDQVYSDHYQGGALIARHAFESGHRRVALVSGPKEISSARLRRKGFLDEAKGRLRIVWETYASFDGELGYASIARLAAPDATFVFAANDLIAVRCIQTLKEAGIRVPSEVSVAGFDDVPWARWVSPSLTTVRQNIDAVGRCAVNTWIDGTAHPRRTPTLSVFPVELVVRESTSKARRQR